ncbi:MAG: hypothetical protein QM817_29265 [Archangium sp.]
MKVSSMLGLSIGWALTALAVAIDVGSEDPLFWPALAMTVPSVVGIGGVLRSLRQKPEPLQGVRVIGFAFVGGLLVTLAVLAIIAGLFWNKPPPGEGEEPTVNGQLVDQQ